MLIRLRDLQTLSVESTDGAHHQVADLLARRDGTDVTHVATRLRRWFEGQGCAIRAAAFGAPDLSANVWPAAISEAEAGDAGSDGPVAVLCAPDALPDPADVAAAEDGSALAYLSAAEGAPVTGADGEAAGTVLDLIVDTEKRRVAMIVVNSGPGGTAHQRVIPAEALSKIDWNAGDLHLSCDASQVGEAPDLHELGDRIEGHWYNRVLAYYGFG
ncbi:PRC-barrel domain-containing protein [Jannaschia aquimarina]|uniref:PRC-barrel domain protein n=1 Tax=Jannaschia aquimarina TaxID=935700 RepID=A0A0D1ELY3_9RHOB|nr:PRC-barrel domain-containing protein [Jannaschia aquimarina]KIT17981.1 PRC-barrel domain protein [Jannaschia aquimarina]SNT04485.1 PRC-barrel domain-containing protein [Jannaschia aquimarina]